MASHLATKVTNQRTERRPRERQTAPANGRRRRLESGGRNFGQRNQETRHVATATVTIVNDGLGISKRGTRRKNRHRNNNKNPLGDKHKKNRLHPIATVGEWNHATYEAVLVGNVVGQLELVERDDFLHPLLASRRTVRVDVHPLGHLRIGFASHHPSTKSKKNTELDSLLHFLYAFRCFFLLDPLISFAIKFPVEFH